MACRFLRRSGYKVLYRNFRPKGGGEVDIVARHLDTLVFVEVKSRRSEKFGRPSAAVNRKKQRLIARGGLAWLKLLKDPEILFRFDVVEVLLPVDGTPEVTLLQNVFELPPPYLY